PVVGVEGLNPDQRRSLETMLKRAVSYLWGPPGTGKTQTLSAAVKTLSRRRANPHLLQHQPGS
ncbi:MAG: AAA domain-containing protein, partial [Rhodoplanes sp.]